MVSLPSGGQLPSSPAAKLTSRDDQLSQRLKITNEQGRYGSQEEEIIGEDWDRKRMIERSNTVFKIK